MRNFAPHPTSLALLAALALSIAPIHAAEAAQGGHLITVAANDGYGVQDCLGESGECGQAVADAWCESEGRGLALSFGPAENAGTAAQAAAYVVTCGD
jgi:hypothetical protein